MWVYVYLCSRVKVDVGKLDEKAGSLYLPVEISPFDCTKFANRKPLRRGHNAPWCLHGQSVFKARGEVAVTMSGLTHPPTRLYIHWVHPIYIYIYRYFVQNFHSVLPTPFDSSYFFFCASFLCEKKTGMVNSCFSICQFIFWYSQLIESPNFFSPPLDSEHGGNFPFATRLILPGCFVLRRVFEMKRELCTEFHYCLLTFLWKKKKNSYFSGKKNIFIR